MSVGALVSRNSDLSTLSLLKVDYCPICVSLAAYLIGLGACSEAETFAILNELMRRRSRSFGPLAQSPKAQAALHVVFEVNNLSTVILTCSLSLNSLVQTNRFLASRQKTTLG